MKTVTIVASLIIAAGIWIEFQKDSSFSSTDTGSLLIGGGLGVLVGNMM